jgi:phenylacetate-CoA ligase
MRHMVAAYMKRRAWSALQELHRSQWLNSEQFERERSARMGQLIRHAAMEVPYYARTLNLGELLDSKGDVRWDKFHNIPILDKDVIRTNWQDLQSRDTAGGYKYSNFSGGSSGEPVHLTQDAVYSNFNCAVKLLIDEWGGIQPGDTIFKIWGSHKDNQLHMQSARNRIIDWARNTYLFDPLILVSQAEMLQHIRNFNCIKPMQLTGYADCVMEFIRVMRVHGLIQHQPCSVLTSAAPLTHEMRVFMSSVLGAPVFNRYGSREVGDIACDCAAHEGLHVMSHTHFVELLDANQQPVVPGQLGSVVVTCLTNRAMPFIRYRIGDMASWSGRACSCGRMWPLLENVDGRVSDYLVTRDGRRLWAAGVHLIFFGRDWIRRFQLIQEDYEFIRIRIQPRSVDLQNREELNRQLEDIRNQLLVLLQLEMTVQVEIVDEIAPSPSGKYMHLISKV